jgi:hypothetical protein
MLRTLPPPLTLKLISIERFECRTTKNVISSTIAHLISCKNGSRFFSHKFSDLLVRQMEATLEGQDINVHIRTSKVPGCELKCWPDSLADDYIHRPLQKEFEDIG